MSKNAEQDFILAADIGGTNINLALVRRESGRFSIAFSRRFATQKETSLLGPMESFLAQSRREGFGGSVGICGISGAGPVDEDCIQLTNASWSIRALELRERFGFPVYLVNDFSAIAYAVALVDPYSDRDVIHLPHSDGSQPLPAKEGIAIVVGPGTGLGLSYMDKGADGSCRVYASEGGHSALPCWDELSFAFYRWLGDKNGVEPNGELAVSGQGIANIFSFLCSSAFAPQDARSYLSSGAPAGASEGAAPGAGPTAATAPGGALPEKKPNALALSILAQPEQERPALIAANYSRDRRCLLAMELFTQFYARKASSFAVSFLPAAGIYLAGGITSKNAAFLAENQRFMRPFERNYSPHIKKYLAEAPVMIVRDYSISLIGAANAAVQLNNLKRQDRARDA